MIRGLEFAGFVALAAMVHAGLWVAAPSGGAGAGGSQGTADVTLEAASPRMAALVEAWQRPVAVRAQAARPAAPALPQAAPVVPRAQAAPRRVARPAAPAMTPPEAGPPQVDTIPAARPSALRPVARPAPPPAPAAAPAPSPARPKEVARGRGARAAGGAQQSAAPATLDAAARASLMAEWGGGIRARIERQKRYPAGTRASGTVHLALTVAANGRLLGVAVRQSSGDAALDRAALGAVQRARLPAKPGALPGASHRFNLPVAFRR